MQEEAVKWLGKMYNVQCHLKGSIKEWVLLVFLPSISSFFIELLPVDSSNRNWS